MEDNRKFVICAECGSEMYYSDDLYDQDDCYEFEDNYYCDNCIYEVVKCSCYKVLTDSSQYEHAGDY